MTLENSSIELVTSLRTLHEAVSDLFRLVAEDRPYEHALAHRFEHATGEILGRLDAALNAAFTLQKIAEQYDHGQAFSALGICHSEFNLAAEKFHNEPESFDWLQDLYALGNEHPDEWMGWVTSIRATLDQCTLSAVHDALLRCWQSLLVSSGAMSTRHIKNIGLHISSPETEVALSDPGQ
jgi:hypothetical protein